MAVAKTKEDQAVELFNQLALMSFGDDVEEAVRLLFRLRAMDAGYPSMTVKVSRADAALIAGYHDEVIECLDSAWYLRAGTDDFSLLNRLQLLLTLAGQTARAVELAHDLLREPGLIDDLAVINLTSTALWAGDVYLLGQIAERESKTGHSVSANILGELKRCGIDTVIAEHQRILRDVLQDYQLAVSSRISDVEGRYSTLVNVFYFDGTKTTRKVLERQVDQALDAHYRSKGNQEEQWRDKIMTVITEAPRHAGVELGRAA